MTHHVLLVGEKPIPLGSLAAALRDNGFAVSVAQDDREALEILASREPDVLVVLDDGAESRCITMLRSVREHDRDLPIILIGRRCQVDVALQALKLGRVEYVNRPVSLRRLCDKIEDVLERQSYYEELVRLTGSQLEE